MLKQKWTNCLGWVAMLIGAIAYSPLSAKAQITPDATLGTEVSTTTVDNLPTQLIQGGSTQGSSLFHSFSDFNIDLGEAVYFKNPFEIENILSRVTGGNLSTINGLLGVDGNANLFLLNPNGIVFGSNARLDVAGSFAASTGDHLTFADGSEFSTATAQDALLSISTPLGLQLNTPVRGDIINRGNLEAGVGEDFTLLGSNIDNRGQISARGGGNIFLATPQTIGRSVIVDGGRIDTNVQPGSSIDGGDIRITTYDLTVQNNGLVTADTLGQGNSGRVEIRAAGDVVVDGEQSGITSQVEQSSTGNSGGIVIAARNLSVLNAGEVSASTFGEGGSGLLKIEADDTVRADGSDSHITSRVEESGTGDSGGITIITDTLLVADGALVGAETWGRGNSGKIEIRADKDVVVDGKLSFISSRVDPRSTGNSNGIAIAARNLSVLNDGEISASTFSNGNAGPVEIRAVETVRVEGQDSYITSRVDQSGKGNSGGLIIGARKLQVLDGGVVGADALGEGDSGLIDITAAEDVMVDGSTSRIVSRVGSIGQGNSGGIAIATDNLSVSNDAYISASTSGIGNSGKIAITATDKVVVEGERSYISSQVNSNAIGSSGGVTFQVDSLSVLNDAFISASTSGEGNSGQVQIIATGDVVVDGNDSLIASRVRSGATGNSGGIAIDANNLSVLNNASISASTSGEGNSGQILITTTGDLLVSGELSNITSQVSSTATGNSGGIAVRANNLSVLNDALINASTLGQGNAGQIAIAATGDVLVSGEFSGINSQVTSRAIGDSRGVSIIATNLDVLDNAQVSASTFGQGNAAQVEIATTGRIFVDGDNDTAGIFSTVLSNATGDSGGVAITTDSLAVRGSGQVSASTFGQGNAGPIQIEANTIATPSENSRIAAETTSGGKGGGLRLSSADALTISGLGRLTVETSDTGSAGDIEVNARQFTLTDGVTLSASTTGPTDGGSIAIVADETALRNGSQIAVNATGEGQGGDFNLTGDRLSLSNSSITATTNSTDGGNLAFALQDLLLLRNRSNISTTAGTAEAGGNGGIITIEVSDGFILAVADEDSNITANAFSGDGGQVNVTARSLLGISPQSQETRFSDLTASSRFGDRGAVTISEINPEPLRETVELPIDTAPPPFSQGCSIPTDEAGSFVVSGRGGLPTSPTDTFRTNTLWQDIAPIAASLDTEPYSSAPDIQTDTLPSSEIVEAQGITRSADGTITLLPSAQALAQCPFQRAVALPDRFVQHPAG